MSYTSRFKVTLPDLAPEIRQAMNGILLHLEREFKAIEKSAIDSNQIRTVVSVSGGGGSSAVSHLQAGQSTVGTSPTTITLSTSVSSYVVLYRATNASNESVAVDITGISSGSFVATAVESCTLYWAIIPI